MSSEFWLKCLWEATGTRCILTAAHYLGWSPLSLTSVALIHTAEPYLGWFL